MKKHLGLSGFVVLLVVVFITVWVYTTAVWSNREAVNDVRQTEESQR